MPLSEILEQNKTRILVVCALFFIGITLVFFPSYFASTDERGYLKNSLLLQKGTMIEPDPTVACGGKFNGEGYVSQYFIGRSLFTIPFTWLGFDVVMLSGLVLHVINFFIFIKILRRLKYNELYSLFYLLFPAFFWASRTLNAELLALTGILGGVYFYLSAKNRDSIFAGVFFGIALLARYEVLLIIAAFYLIPLLQKKKKFLFLLAGILPILLFIMTFNTTVYGGAFSSGYTATSSTFLKIFKKPLFIDNLIIHIAILAAFYPFMIFSPLLKKMILRKEILLATAIFVTFYSFNSDPSIYRFLSPVTFTGRIRYLIPLLGLLILAYIPFYRTLIERMRLPKRGVFALVIVFLLGTLVAGSVVHGEFVQGRYTTFQTIYDHTTTGSLLIGSEDDCNYVINEFFDDRFYLDVNSKHLPDLYDQFEEVYVLDIFYSSVDPESYRGGLVAGRRQKIKDFIESNKESLELVYNTNDPHHISIYRVTKKPLSLIS